MYLIQRVLTNKSATDTINLYFPMSKIKKKERQEWMGTLFLRYLFSNWRCCCRHELMLRDTQRSMVRAWSDPRRQPPADEKEGRKRVFSLFFLIHSICTSRWVKRQTILGSSSWAQGWPLLPRWCWRAPAGALHPLDRVQGPTGYDQHPARLPSHLWLFWIQQSEIGFLFSTVTLSNEWSNLKGDAEPEGSPLERCETSLHKSVPWHKEEAAAASLEAMTELWGVVSRQVAWSSEHCLTLSLRFVHFLLVFQPPSESGSSSSRLDSGRGSQSSLPPLGSAPPINAIQEYKLSLKISSSFCNLRIWPLHHYLSSRLWNFHEECLDIILPLCL